ncbi:hypothetical protein [Microbacterium maritypicum]
MFESFSHFLAYGSTDQETLRELTREYDGLLVPGTIAAYQADGTRGFVLSLSAAVERPYTIDPRTPLFQYVNGAPKQSHLALARVLGIDSEVEAHGMVRPDTWTPEFCRDVARAWVDFNSDYTTITPKQFDKYARRLGKQMPVADASLPTWILAPYLMHTPDFDATRVNDRLWRAATNVAGNRRSQLRRVVAANLASDLRDAALNAGEEEVVVWLDNLDEVDPSNAGRLAGYAKAVAEIGASGIKPFALYGGYFAVALATVGLRGASHGVGFSEHRDHVELKTSGGAPARFYVQRLHRYLPVDIASELWRQRPALVESYYPQYRDRDPGEYTYHELMKHSVYARANEIDATKDATTADVAQHLASVASNYRSELTQVSLSRPVQRRVEASIAHLPVWSRALNDLRHD